MDTADEIKKLLKAQHDLKRASEMVDTALGIGLDASVFHLQSAQAYLIETTVSLGFIEESVVARIGHQGYSPIK